MAETIEGIGRRCEEAEIDAPKEHCAVIALVYNEGAPDMAYQGFELLQEHQHRGEDGAGMVLYDQDGFAVSQRGTGKVDQVISDGGEMLQNLLPDARVLIGHGRYSTSGEGTTPWKESKITLSHNGHLTNVDKVADMFDVPPERRVNDSGCASYMLNELVAKYEMELAAASKYLFSMLTGSFSLAITDGKTTIGIRDPSGVKPFFVAENEYGHVFASEDGAMRVFGVENENIREVEPGEMVIVENGEVTTDQLDRVAKLGNCAFEFGYFLRPDSTFNGRLVSDARFALGYQMAMQELEKGEPITAKWVTHVPASSKSQAEGFAAGMRLPHIELFKKRQGSGRSFILPTDEARLAAAWDKLIPQEMAFKEHDIDPEEGYTIDDTLVRGITAGVAAVKARRLGVMYNHLRITFPPVLGECPWGTEMGSKPKELLAAYMSDEEIAKDRDYTSVAFLDFGRMVLALDPEGQDSLCTGCIDGSFPDDNVEVRTDAGRLLLARQQLVTIGG